MKHRRCAEFLHPISPSRECSLIRHFIQHPVFAIHQQGVDHRLGADNAGIDVSVIFGNDPEKIPEHHIFILFLHQTKIKCQGHGCLPPVIVDALFRIEITPVESRLNFPGQCLVSGGVAHAARDAGHFGEHSGEMIIKRRGEDMALGEWPELLVVVDSEVQEVVFGMVPQVFHILPEPVVVPADDRGIAGEPVQLPGDLHEGPLPLRTVTPLAVLSPSMGIAPTAGGHDAGQLAVFELLVDKIVDPFQVSAGEIEVEQTRFRHQERIAGPAHLFAVRAVGGISVIIAQKGMSDVVVQRIEQVIGTAEITPPSQIGMHNPGLKAGELNRGIAQ